MLELNKIHLGDCYELIKQIPDKSIDLIITDPPYTKPTVTSFGRVAVKNIADLSIQETYMKVIKKEIERVLKPSGSLFLFCDDGYYASIYRAYYDWHQLNLLVWDKGKIGMGKPFRRQHELILYANRGSIEANKSEGVTHYPTIFRFQVEKDKIHEAQKPIKLIEYLVNGFSNENDIVLDLFSGSGTTAIACKNLKRKFISFELNEDYYKASLERLDFVSKNGQTSIFTDFESL